MPQLNIETFVTQYIWLVIMLGVMYYKAENSKELGEIMKLRKKKKEKKEKSKEEKMQASNTKG
jgi:hypothetical protein